MIRSTCPYCGVGCGVKATAGENRTLVLTGDESHPANAGRLCSKGTHLPETVGLDGRLLDPQIGGEIADWDEALNLVAARFSDAITMHGPDSVAFYVSGQILTEDYYVANKLMKGFIGSANIDTNSRLCMASAVAAHNRAFGEDVVPVSYSDLECADLILLVGSNTAWCHPVIWQRIEAARAKNGARLVVIDPRRTETAELADLHVPVAPDGDVALFSALLGNMRARGLTDGAYMADHVDVPSGFWDSLAGQNSATSGGVNAECFAQLSALVAAHPKMITLFSMGVNQSVSGTDKANAIINLHLATGRIGKIGAGPFSMTGQPNAMGGREVGGLASTLAVHMGFSDEECAAAQGYWQSPAIAQAPGLKAVDMFRAVHDGRIKALWVMGTNPAVSMPDAGFVRDALAKCEFLVVSDCMADTDTAQYADVKLPALAWGEKAGMVTNSERVISRQRALFDAPGQAKPDWWALAQVGRRMGHKDAFDFDGPAAVFREFAGQTAFRNDGKRKLNLSQWADISDAAYDAWLPWQWGGASPFSDGLFTHPNGRAKMFAVNNANTMVCSPEFPFILNTGRCRDQWHTMTRTGLSPRLSQHRREALLEIHPIDAAAHGVENGALAHVDTAQGSTIFRAHCTDAQRRGEIFVPMHWADDYSNQGRANRLPSQAVDPVSHQPGFKRSAAMVRPVAAEWRAFLVSRDGVSLTANILYWSRSRIVGGWLYEMAGDGMIDVDSILPAGDRIEAVDMQRGMRRIAVRGGEADQLQAALYLTRSGTLPDREWIAEQLQTDAPADAPELLAARPRERGPDKGQVVCVCFNVGENEIIRTIKARNSTTVVAVGEACNAGTNCGSCRPAIAKILRAMHNEALETA